MHVVSLRELMLADRAHPVAEVGDRRTPISVPPLTDREEVARLISKYNLLAVPVVDEGGHVLGIVTVDDVIDAIVREQTEDVQKFGGMEALDEPYTRDRLRPMIRKRARLALRALSRRDAHRDGDGALRGGDREAPSCWRCSSRSSSARAATPDRRRRR